MPVNRNLIETTKQTPEYQKGLAILGDPDDYAGQTMMEFIGFFYVMSIREAGNVEGLQAFLHQLGIAMQKSERGYVFGCEDEEALTTAFTYIVGRNSKEYFEEFLKHRAELVAGDPQVPEQWKS